MGVVCIRYACLCDACKAFDSVHCGKLFNILLSKTFLNALYIWMGFTRGALSYADDITFSCPSIGRINKILKICDKFAWQNSIIFNSKKTVCINFGDNTIDIINQLYFFGMFLFLVNAFNSTNCIIRTCMNEVMYNANICIGYKLAFYHYTFDLNMYSSMNNAYNVIMSKYLSDEQTAIVHTLKTLLSVRSGNASLDEFTLNEVNDLIHFSTTI